MRFLFSVIVALTVSLCIYATIKMWGQSQVFIDYQHPFLAADESPLYFQKPQDGWNLEDLKKQNLKNLYLDLAVTADSIPVILRKHIDRVRTHKLTEIQTDVYTAEQIKDMLQGKKVIFNFTENPISGPELIIEFITQIGFSDGRNFLIVSPLEIPLKFLKEKMPTYLYGASQPEITRMKALESLGLVEASTFRADVVVYPLEFYHHDFFTETLIKELQKRYKKFIIGPMTTADFEKSKDRVLSKKPFAVIVD